ncbi:hypothetical protein BT96DRAFT_942166 [Gymnopus androsaceus JB14]|uniref:Uncharacterized protein n=1 Tax=Gymnopus androsaceus JB14 TaxID=1447944 RepID=A0A6A4HET4_9AGAR|nr:hypothetical protein BT96DRAFT_942166 [Gymnopus androsaceus JB14]
MHCGGFGIKMIGPRLSQLIGPEESQLSRGSEGRRQTQTQAEWLKRQLAGAKGASNNLRRVIASVDNSWMQSLAQKQLDLESGFSGGWWQARTCRICTALSYYQSLLCALEFGLSDPESLSPLNESLGSVPQVFSSRLVYTASAFGSAYCLFGVDSSQFTYLHMQGLFTLISPASLPYHKEASAKEAATLNHAEISNNWNVCLKIVKTRFDHAKEW